MAKREFIEVNQLEKITLEDSLNYMEWHRDSEVDCAIVAPRLTEQDIVRPYLEKLKIKMEERDNDNGGEPLNMVDRGYHLAFEHLCIEIDNLLSAQGDTE